MKTYKHILSATLMCFHFHLLFSQADSSSLIRLFGIGLHAEQFKVSEKGDVITAPANKIVLAISPARSFRLEPEFGYTRTKDKINDLKTSGVYMGLGAFGMFQFKKTNTYVGLRSEYASIESDQIWMIDSSHVAHHTKRLTWMPTVGCEYYLGLNLAVGGEFGLKYTSLETIQTPSSTLLNYAQRNSFLTTDTGLFLRFFF